MHQIKTIEHCSISYLSISSIVWALGIYNKQIDDSRFPFHISIMRNRPIVNSINAIAMFSFYVIIRQPTMKFTICLLFFLDIQSR